SDSPDGDESDQKVAAYWNDGGNEAESIISAYIVIVSAVALATFVTIGFRGRSTSPLVRLARAFGLVAAAAFGIGAMALAAPAAAALFDNATISAEGSSLILSMGFGTMTVFGAIAAAAMIGAISAEWLRSRVMPAWLAWLGFVCAV